MANDARTQRCHCKTCSNDGDGRHDEGERSSDGDDGNGEGEGAVMVKTSDACGKAILTERAVSQG